MRTFRLYFNRKSEAPQIWSVDEGDQESEVNLINFKLMPGCMATGEYNGTPVNPNTPSALMLIQADYYSITSGVAYFWVESNSEE